MYLWGSSSESRSFFGDAELTAWIEDGKGAPKIEMRQREVDAQIRRLLPEEICILQPDFEANMSDWLRERLEPSGGKRSPIVTNAVSIELAYRTAKDGSRKLGGKLQLSGTVPPLAELLLPVGLDYGQPDRMDPALLDWISKLKVWTEARWVRYAPLNREGKALSWAEAARVLATPGEGVGLIATIWDGKTWVHSQLPVSLLAARPRPELRLGTDGTLTWSWSVKSKIVQIERDREGAAAGRIALSPAPTVRLRQYGSEGVGFWGVLWRIPATPVTLVADLLLLPAVVVMGTAMLFGYDV